MPSSRSRRASTDGEIISPSEFRALALQGYSGVGHQYCRDIVAGTIPACLFIRHACQATLDDLAKQKRKDFEYYYDAPYAERINRFMHLLPHVKGKWAKLADNRLKFEPWQIWMTCRLMGWKSKRTGFRRFTELYAEIPRKNAKTTWLSALAVYMAFADGEFGAEVYCGASKLEQAMILFTTAKLQLTRTPELLATLDVEAAARSLWRESDGSKFMPVVGDPGDGNSPSMAVLDELHEQKDAALRDAMQTGFGAREQPLLAQITTAGVNTEGPCFEVRSNAIEVLKGERNGGLREDSLFAVIYTLDEGDEPLTIESLKKANPNFGVSVQEEYLRRQIQKAKNDPGEAYIVRTKHLNIWGGVKESYFNMEAWRACEDRSLKVETFVEKTCYMGLDLASRDDLVSRILVFPELRPSNISDDRTGRERLERHYTVFGFHYSPKANIYDGSHKNYVGWHEAAEQWLIGHDGVEVKLALVQEDIEADLNRFADVKNLCFDKAYARQMQQDLEEKTPTDTVVDIPQTAQFMSDAMKEIKVAVKAGRVHHAGDPVLAWCMGNVVSRTDTNGNDKADKKDKKRKIDAATAFINAMTFAYSVPLAAPRRYTDPHIGLM